MATASSVPLPPGWTQHKAPSGHTYYYNAATKKSTYKHPGLTEPPVHTSPPADPLVPVYPQPYHQEQQHPYNGLSQAAVPSDAQRLWEGQFDRRHNFRPPRREPQDRPKTVHPIPDNTPWLLVKTKLRRRFVYNPETRESCWKPPNHLLAGLIEFDIQERRRLQGENVSQPASIENKDNAPGVSQPETASNNEDDYDEIEEIIEEDDEEDQPAAEDSHQSKRQKADDLEDEAMADAGGDDTAWQLAELDEYGDEEDDEWDGGEQLSSEEAADAFREMLDEHHINPFSTFDSVIEAGAIVDDDRYTLLPTTKARRDVFAAWSTERIAALKEEKAKQAKQNPKIPYLIFLQQHATPKLFWQEFRRKFKKEPELKDSKLADKDREKLYREHINRTTKLSNSTLEADLKALLSSIPASKDWNASTSLQSSALPAALTADVRFVSLPTSTRDAIIQDFIATKLPQPEDVLSAEEKAAAERERAERRRRDDALRDRQRQADEERQRQRRQLMMAKGRADESRRELEQAMNVDRRGLLEALGDGGHDQNE